MTFAVLLAAGACGVGACGGNPTRPLRPEYDLRSPDPEIRTRAVAHVANQRDASQIPTLIFLLDDDDAAVRAAAHATLVTLTGHDTGYRPYEPSEVRRRHQREYREWWSQQGTPAAAQPSFVPPATGSDDGRRP